MEIQSPTPSPFAEMVSAAGREISQFLGSPDVLRLAQCCKASAVVCSVDELWAERLLKDFRYRDLQSNRSKGYYKSLYIGMLEEGIMEENLIAGGH
mmetsp:Transcript_9745/g.21675  ORF Transcript_9745/g.21675 Transcript_9745/m.21675 type:complete len:96 (-) Transcript_9745:1504-1791(-)|eukprot:CAMPEP_0173169606 /NCGR_PEP_ID=MMETSP1141-20130122/799_1 /TAXON_ID=483371 /ORGANISM="non described non described, Strain CCMP2298" /LENGTH=95 /DNA_ID=CAMNT_0014091455 /DNA_START=223 /DNA_END=510 /DNA_ORIENTATION=-